MISNTYVVDACMLFALIGAMDSSCSNGSYEQVPDRRLASSSRPAEAYGTVRLAGNTKYRNRLYSRLENPFSPGFLTGSTNPELKGSSFSPGFSLVPVGKTNRD